MNRRRSVGRHERNRIKFKGRIFSGAGAKNFRVDDFEFLSETGKNKNVRQFEHEIASGSVGAESTGALWLSHGFAPSAVLSLL